MYKCIDFRIPIFVFAKQEMLDYICYYANNYLLKLYCCKIFFFRSFFLSLVNQITEFIYLFKKIKSRKNHHNFDFSLLFYFILFLYQEVLWPKKISASGFWRSYAFCGIFNALWLFLKTLVYVCDKFSGDRISRTNVEFHATLYLFEIWLKLISIKFLCKSLRRRRCWHVSSKLSI